MPEPISLVVERNVPIPMRDGVTLYADVYRPSAPGRYPVLLQRTPYDKSMLGTTGQLVLRATAAGYAVVVQDVRGRFTSEGEFYTFVHERDDGHDTIEWLVAQPWSDGSVGMYGQSYVGLTQWQAALSGHPALKAIVPGVTADNYHDGWVYQGGAFELSFNLSWTLSVLMTNTVSRAKADDPAVAAEEQSLFDAIDGMTQEFARLPLTDNSMVTKYAPYYDGWTRHAAYDEFWEKLDVSRAHGALSVPALNTGGWYDIFLKGTIGNFTGMRARSPNGANQRLLIGPWNHSGMRAGNPIADIDFGIRSTGAAIDIDAIHLRWYDRWLKGIENGVDDEPPVRIFVMGANQWRFEHEWPLARTDYQDWFFHSGGRANTLNGDGALSREAPASEPPDRYRYNPLDPTPTMGGPLCCNNVFSLGGPRDQRRVEEREDVLVYTSAPLEEPIEVTGPVKVVLYAASSAPDTDFTAKLDDVAPCGYARNLCDGIVRARFRDSIREETLLTPGEVYEYEIDLVATGNRFKKDHRIRVEIASANFPRFDRNPNNGELPGRSGEMVSADQTVLHSGEYPSRIILPVIAPGS
jgi:uncharacterized protein